MSAPNFLNSIALLRAIAVSFVIYAHLVGQQKFSWWPKQLVSDYFFEPLHIFQHGGALGVAIFFLVSGYIIPYVAYHESRKEFALKRFLRIYPPLWFSLCLVFAIFFSLQFLNLQNFWSPEIVSLKSILLSASLTNNWGGQENINGVAWTLRIEVAFYIWIALLMTLLFRKAMLAIAITIISAGLTFASHSFFSFTGELLNSFIFICFMFLGTLIYLRQMNLISMRLLFFWTAIFWMSFLYGIDEKIASLDNPTSGYIVSYGLAYLVFAVTVFLEPKIKIGLFCNHIAKISYSLYLLHAVIGLLVITHLAPLLGYPLALAFAALLIYSASHLSHLYIEKPSQGLARRLSRSI